MKNSFVHKGFTVSMTAVRNDADPERVRFDVAVVIEDISTGQFLLNETRLVEAPAKTQGTSNAVTCLKLYVRHQSSCAPRGRSGSTRAPQSFVPCPALPPAGFR